MCIRDRLKILNETTGRQKVEINPIITGEELIKLREWVREVHLNDELLKYVARLIRNTRPDTSQLSFIKDWISWGAGPRAGQAIILAAKARAIVRQRLAVIPEDIQAVVPPALRHRLLLNFKAEAEGIQPDEIIRQLLEKITPPQSSLI